MNRFPPNWTVGEVFHHVLPMVFKMLKSKKSFFVMSSLRYSNVVFWLCLALSVWLQWPLMTAVLIQLILTWVSFVLTRGQLGQKFQECQSVLVEVLCAFFCRPLASHKPLKVKSRRQIWCWSSWECHPLLQRGKWTSKQANMWWTYIWEGLVASGNL